MSEAHEINAGQLVASRYRVERVIDRGRHGRGLSGRPTNSSAARIAIKFFFHRIFLHGDAGRFGLILATEARALSALNHPQYCHGARGRAVVGGTPL